MISKDKTLKSLLSFLLSEWVSEWVGGRERESAGSLHTPSVCYIRLWSADQWPICPITDHLYSLTNQWSWLIVPPAHFPLVLRCKLSSWWIFTVMKVICLPSVMVSFATSHVTASFSPHSWWKARYRALFKSFILPRPKTTTF